MNKKANATETGTTKYAEEGDEEMTITLHVDQELYAETDQTGPAGIDAMMEEASAGFDLENYELAALRDYKVIHIAPTNPDQEYTTVELRATDQFSIR